MIFIQIVCPGFTHVLVTSHVRVFDHGEHDLLPGLSGGAPEQQQHGPAEGLEVVVPVHVRVVVQSNSAEDLHPHHAVDEEDEGDEDGDPGQGLEGLEEGPEESSDSFIFVQQLDETSNTEQSEEPDRSIAVRLREEKLDKKKSNQLLCFVI